MWLNPWCWSSRGPCTCVFMLLKRRSDRMTTMDLLPGESKSVANEAPTQLPTLTTQLWAGSNRTLCSANNTQRMTCSGVLPPNKSATYWCSSANTCEMNWHDIGYCSAEFVSEKSVRKYSRIDHVHNIGCSGRLRKVIWQSHASIDTHICPSGAYVEPVIKNSWRLQLDSSALSKMNIWRKEKQQEAINYSLVNITWNVTGLMYIFINLLSPFMGKYYSCCKNRQAL